MSSVLDIHSVKRLLATKDLQTLFVDHLGWNNGGTRQQVVLDGHLFSLLPIAQKCGMVAYECNVGEDEAIPDYQMRQKISRQATRTQREHLIMFSTSNGDEMYWQWVKTQYGRPNKTYYCKYKRGIQEQDLIERLSNLKFTLEQEENLTILDVTRQVSAAFNAEKVTKRFYDQYNKKHMEFSKAIEGFDDVLERDRYASLLLYRLMFLYFIQRRGFLNSETDYLMSHLKSFTDEQSSGDMFYGEFLIPLFKDALGKHESERSPELNKIVGKVPYLDGGLFGENELEQSTASICIPDEAFKKIFEFFESYRWHLDDRPLQSDNEINPDVLGYIFEKYINQKQMGAYYTKEDVTGYICTNTILPRILDMAEKLFHGILQDAEEGCLDLHEYPERYLHKSMIHGLWYDNDEQMYLDGERELPESLKTSLEDVTQRREWNDQAPEEYALPTETWRNCLTRRDRAKKLRGRVKMGLKSTDEVVSLNIDLEQVVLDIITGTDKPEVVLAFWNALKGISVLDPTCGSGAFLFAALRILEPPYAACIEAMRRMGEEYDAVHNDKVKNALEMFRDVLQEIDNHVNERYYIMKSIVACNLFGVDIMEEAVEICKLRLFLKLVAQVDNVDDMEPLPDIDFNIKTGNALVGFSDMQKMETAIKGDLVMESAWENVETRIKLADEAVRGYREAQSKRGIESEEGLQTMKEGLNQELRLLRCELDDVLAKHQGVDENDGQAMCTWKLNTKPFHWSVEFYSAMDNGGFDVVIGNPPYISIKKIDYKLSQSVDDCGTDVYGHVLSKTTELTKHDGRCGMIVPLSITFGRDFNGLRERIVNWGSCWFSSYGIIPASLFTDVSQNCTIWLGRAGKGDVFTAPVARWRAKYRPYLLSNLSYTKLPNTQSVKNGIPRLTGDSAPHILRKIEKLSGEWIRAGISRKGKTNHEVFYSLSARNFISVSLVQAMYYMEGNYKGYPATGTGSVFAVSEGVKYATLASLSGELFYWFWLMNSDEFHVTKGVVENFLCCLNKLSDQHLEGMENIGRVLQRRRQEWIVFKKNAGHYVGKYNFRWAFELTRRADLLLFSGLNVSKDDAISVLNYVQGLLSVNEQTGEKNIPEALKARYRPEKHEIGNTAQENAMLKNLDKLICDSLLINAEELEYLITMDLVLWGRKK